MTSEKPLKILSASAGSGKTFSIVITYLRLVIKDKARFNSILAMTFTKAASLEMRNRIVEALNNLSLGLDQSYIKTVSEILSLDEIEIQMNAKRVLTEILHNYEDFQISTLDKFNLRLVKTFSRELNLEENFETVVDASEILEEAIDTIISKVNEPGNENITTLMLGYAKVFADGEKKWRIKNDLVSISNDFKGENNAAMIETLTAQPSIPVEAYWIMANELKEIQTLRKEVWDDFIAKNHDNLDELKKSYRQAIDSFYKNCTMKNAANLDKCLNDEENYQFAPVLESKITQIRSYFKKEMALSFKMECFFPLESLKLIAKELKTILDDRKLFLLSDTSALIAELIQDEETPFIYEKLGNRFGHFLLDEFQDTSRKQWNNLFPLVFDALSREGKPEELQKSMIVGDAKQSIYRFRGGVSAQFVALPALYNPENNGKIADRSRRFEERGIKEPLPFNFRSLKNIVNFNNAFFEEMKTVLDKDYLEYYEDVKQEAKKEDGGFVEYIHLEYDQEALDIKTNFEFEEENEEDTLIAIDFVYIEIKKIIANVLDSGFCLGDICLLSRTKKPLTEIASLLSKDDINVVSIDSLMISNSPGVQLIVNFLKFQNDPFSGELAFLVNQSLEQMTGKTVSTWLEQNLFSELIIFTAEELQKVMQNPIFRIDFDNLYDAGIQAIRLFGLENKIDYFLQHLLDMLHQYDMNWNNDLASFIEFWNSKGYKESVLLPASDNAIQIMTVHKSKGLEFPIVIMLDKLWMTVKRKNVKYFLSDENEIYYTHLYKKSSSKLIIDKLELEEKELQLDFVNLMYVACTRATQRLYMIDSVKKRKEKESTNKTTISSKIETHAKSPTMEMALSAMLNVNPKIVLSKKSSEYAEVLYAKLGTEDAKVIEKTKKTEDTLNMKLSRSGRTIWFPSISYENREKLESNSLSEERQYGNNLHFILSKLSFKIEASEIDKVVQLSVQKGEILAVYEAKIIKDLKRILQFEPYRKLVETATKILNEQTLVKSNGTILRPDKILQLDEKNWIVIDFKTGAKEPKHKSQVHEYKALLSQILGDNVDIQGLLFYTSSLEMVEV